MSKLGVDHLESFWKRHLASRTAAIPASPASADLCADRVLLAGLRLGLRETLDFLIAGAPSFAEFEQWVLARNGGSIDPDCIARLNAALTGERSFTLETILRDPVLSPADLAFWDEHGYVVLKQAVTRDACGAAVVAIFEHAGMSPGDPDSWYRRGIWIPLAHHPAIWANRNSPRIHTAFAQLWQRADLWMNVDVCGVNPPIRPGYGFQGTPLHWDMTLAPPLRFGTQAILYLTDTPANQGAFSCVPGLHRRLEAWLTALPPGADPRAFAADTLHPVPIPGEAGDLVVWHQALPHAATPNLAAFPRVVQYLTMFPSRHEINAAWL